MPIVVPALIGAPGQQFFDNNGVPLSGGKLYTYLAGTSTPAATYTDATGVTANTNPITLDSAGRLPNNGAWKPVTVSYKFVLQNSLGVTIGTWDTINDNVSQSAVYCEANRTATDQVFASGVNGYVRYNHANVDSRNLFDSVNGLISAPADGKYLVNATLELTPNATTPNIGGKLLLALYKNNNYLIQIDRYNVDVNPVTGQAIVFMNRTVPIQLVQGDFIGVQLNNQTTISWTMAAGSQSLFKMTN